MSKYQRLLPHELELPLQLACERTLTLYGWVWYHRPDRAAGARERAGFPDLMAVHPCGRILIIENKSIRGKLTPQQVIWMTALGKFRNMALAWHFDQPDWRPDTPVMFEVLELKPGLEHVIESEAQCKCGLSFDEPGWEKDPHGD